MAAARGRNPDNLSYRGKSNGRFVQVLEIRAGDFSNTITTVEKDNYIVEYECPDTYDSGVKP